jgi:hypothetical protein
VPGSVSLIGLAKLVDTHSAAGITGMSNAIGAIFATAFRILSGARSSRPLTLLGRTAG